jgi:hypothetical protein
VAERHGVFSIGIMGAAVYQTWIDEAGTTCG